MGRSTPPTSVPSRCWTAIYTRQSRSSLGDFSSCEAQLSVCLKFVMARLGDGWVWNGKRYDDEGESGETLDRPELQRLLADGHADNEHGRHGDASGQIAGLSRSACKERRDDSQDGSHGCPLPRRMDQSPSQSQPGRQASGKCRKRKDCYTKDLLTAPQDGEDVRTKGGD
jgi:hypothetical protein